MENTYWVYGLVVQSEILLEELELYRGTERQRVDVKICCREMSEDIKEEVQKGTDHCFTRDKLWFSIKNTATYFIKDIDCIEVDIFHKADNQSVKTFLLGSALGMLMIKRRRIAIHGGAVVVNGSGIILTGDSGAGKSTLTAAFIEKGYKFLADDVSALSEDENNNIMIMPGYPQQKLCRDAVEKFEYFNESSIRKIDEDRDKYAVRVGSSFRKTAVKLKAIYELSIEDIDDVNISRVTGKDKLIIIFKNIFRFGLIEYIGMDAEYFKKCVHLAKSIEVYRMVRPRRGDTVNKQIEVIEGTIEEVVLQ